MRRTILLLLIGLLFYGCDRDNIIDNDEYYVKYSLTSTTIYYGGKLDVNINTGTGSQLLNVSQRTKWETTIGPVKKGFNSSLNIKKQDWDGKATENHLALTAKIELSKKGSPFYMVKIDDSSTPRATCEIKYVIN